tara:strand:- start:4523 stop:5434 length:912 start_codon:yes stop_codon:yes gene_type:complete
MAYIGNNPNVNFTSFAKQDLTGVTGSPAKRGFTLSHAVANANEIAIYVNNVRQEPTEAYTVNGTGLTMTGDVETSDDFYVIFLGKAIQTTVPPDGSVSTAKIANSAVNLTSKVTGILPVANGGTGASTFTTITSVISSGNAGSAVSELEIDLPTDASYHKFELSIHDIYFSADTDLATMFRVQTSGSYSASYTYSTMERTYGASPSGASNNAGSGNAQMSYYNIGDALVEAASYNIIITNNKTASYHTKYFYTAYGLASNANATVRVGGGSVHALEINDRMKLFPLSGTMTHGEWVLYGWKKS